MDIQRQDFSSAPWDQQLRQDLVTLILRYVKQNREWIHQTHNVALHFRSGSRFFIWHRELMNGLDRYLQQRHALPPLPSPSTVAAGPGATYVAAPEPTTSSGPPRASRPGRGQMVQQTTTADRIKKFDYKSRGINRHSGGSETSGTSG